VIISSSSYSNLVVSSFTGYQRPLTEAALYANITMATPTAATNRASQISGSRTYNVGRSMAFSERPALNEPLDLYHDQIDPIPKQATAVFTLGH
jgi:hypothetical protein